MFAEIFNWLLHILYKFGLYRKQGTILLLGLDNAGKTTLLYLLKDGTISNYVPTTRPNIKTVQIGGLELKAWDLGGHRNVRSMWYDYYSRCDALIFMIDSADIDRFTESKEELDLLLREPELKDIPFLILGNKCDLKNAVSGEKLSSNFEINKMARHVNLFSVSLLDRTGYEEAFKWLGDVLL